MRGQGGILLPLERRGHAPPPELIERRAQLMAGVVAGQWRTEPMPQDSFLGGIGGPGGGHAHARALRFRPAGRIKGRVLHFHGGAFRLGCPEIVSPFAAALAAACGVEVVVPAYRLAPEHPFPAGLSDALAALHAVAREGGVGPHRVPLILSGDSAGAGLAASLAVLAAQEGIAIDALVLLSPFLDLTLSGPSYQYNEGSDPLFSLASAANAVELYLQGGDPTHPLASPLFAPLYGFPPTLLSVGSGEVLADDTRRFHAQLAAYGIPTALSEIEGMEHTAVVRSPLLPGSAETFAAITDLVDDITRP
jgi:acetyl esterase/lipase